MSKDLFEFYKLNPKWKKSIKRIESLIDILVQGKTLSRTLLTTFNMVAIMVAQSEIHIYPKWNMIGPLNLTNFTTIPSNTLKSLMNYDCSKKSAYKHYLDVIAIRKIHTITEEDVMVRLLAQSFRGKILDWYRFISYNSITIWC